MLYSWDAGKLRWRLVTNLCSATYSAAVQLAYRTHKQYASTWSNGKRPQTTSWGGDSSWRVSGKKVCCAFFFVCFFNQPCGVCGVALQVVSSTIWMSRNWNVETLYTQSQLKNGCMSISFLFEIHDQSLHGLGGVEDQIVVPAPLRKPLHLAPKSTHPSQRWVQPLWCHQQTLWWCCWGGQGHSHKGKHVELGATAETESCWGWPSVCNLTESPRSSSRQMLITWIAVCGEGRY